MTMTALDAAVPSPATIPITKLIQHPDDRASIKAAAGGHDSVLEPKYDGWRSIWRVEHVGWKDDPETGEQVEICRTRFFSRKGIEYTGKMPAVEQAISDTQPSGTVFEGEVVQMEVVNGVLVPRWGGVQSVLGSGVAKAALASGSLTLVLYDILAHGPHDARSLPFKNRRSVLETMYANAGFDPMKIMLSEQLEATEEMHGALIEVGYEGSVVKWLDAPYRSGVKGHGQFKIKAVEDVDAIVLGYKPGEGGFTGLVGAIIFGQYTKDGLLVPRGSCSGMKLKERIKISQNRDAYLGRVFSFVHNGQLPPSIDHPLGAFRHPRFKTWRDDKPAEEAVVQ